MFENNRQQICLTEPRPQIRELDQLPIINRSLVDNEKYNRFIGQAMVKHCLSLQATRGCPYKCLYCHKIWPKKHYARSAENVFTEIKIYYDMGIRRFSFIDDIFNLDIRNSSRFCELVIKNRLEVQLFFPGGFRGDILTEEFIDLLVEAGTVNIALALETASPRVQKVIRKYLNIEKFKKNMEYICTKHPRVILELFTIMGIPTETETEAMMTLDFIKQARWIHFPYNNILKIFPNTDMENLALQSGISRQAIREASNLAYDEIPGTLPYDKKVAQRIQTELLHGYFLSRERLMHVLPYQANILSSDELIQKYNSYLPGTIDTFEQLLDSLGISKEEWPARDCKDDNHFQVPDLNRKIHRYFPPGKPEPDALRILLLDLTHFFTTDRSVVYDVAAPPLGLLYLLSYLEQQLGNKIKGKIAKSRMDFDSYPQLGAILEEFNPEVIGIRTLTLFKTFYHKTAAWIRQWGFQGPIIAGGPYATSDYQSNLQDANIDLVVIGEGEMTFYELITAIINNKGTLPPKDTLLGIPGLAFVQGNSRETEPADKNTVTAPTRHQQAQTILSQFNDDLENE